MRLSIYNKSLQQHINERVSEMTLDKTAETILYRMFYLKPIPFVNASNYVLDDFGTIS
jgi:hypothetical protein